MLNTKKKENKNKLYYWGNSSTKYPSTEITAQYNFFLNIRNKKKEIAIILKFMVN